jgi:hypothetical protein
MPGVTTGWKRRGTHVPWSLRRKHDPADTLILDLWLPELWNSSRLWFKVIVCGNLLLQPQEASVGAWDVYRVNRENYPALGVHGGHME